LKKVKDFLFIYPRLKYPTGDAPLGILYLASVLRSRLGIVPDILDLGFCKKPVETLRSHLVENNYQWIGISAMITMAGAAREVAMLVRQIQPEAKVILGGPHPTTLAEQCATEMFDFLAIGESEDSLVELVEKGEGQGISGIWFKSGDKWAQNPARAPIENLDLIPFPAFDLIELEKYMKLWFQLDTLRKPILGVNIIATRGCPYQCSFCQPTLEKLFGRRLRKRSPGNIVAELKWLKERFKIQGFNFMDDTLVVDRVWCKALAKEIIDAKLDLVFGCNIRADLAEREVLDALKEAGLRKVYIGIEAYSDRIRNQILNKKVERAEIENAVGLVKSLDLSVQGFFMIGAPGETRKEVKQTLAYARTLNIDDLTINITTPLPRTYLYEQFQSEIALKEEDFDYYRRYAFREKDLSESWLRRVQVLGYLRFYLVPRRFVSLLRTVFSLRMLWRNWLKLRRVF